MSIATILGVCDLGHNGLHEHLSHPTLILHHYNESPYAEKIRAILGWGLAWQSVVVPMMMPKPDAAAPTGGYRKVPVLQIGADVY